MVQQMNRFAALVRDEPSFSSSGEEVAIIRHYDEVLAEIKVAASHGDAGIVRAMCEFGQYYRYNVPVDVKRAIVMALGDIGAINEIPSGQEGSITWGVHYILKYWHSQPEAGVALFKIAKRHGLVPEVVEKLQDIAAAKPSGDDTKSWMAWNKSVKAAAAKAVLSDSVADRSGKKEELEKAGNRNR